MDLAAELFRLHLGGELLRRRLVPSFREASAWVHSLHFPVELFLEALCLKHPVVLSSGCSPSLAGVGAFHPRLTRGCAVSLSPSTLVRLFGDVDLSNCKVKVFLPLGSRARQECCGQLMNPLAPTALDTRSPVLKLTREACSGLFLASLPRPGARGGVTWPGGEAGGPALMACRTLAPDDPWFRALKEKQLRVYGSLRGFYSGYAEVEQALARDSLSPNASVIVKHNGHLMLTVAGRCRVMGLPVPLRGGGAPLPH